MKILHFTLETPVQPCIWQIAGERHLGTFFHAFMLYSALRSLLSPDMALPIFRWWKNKKTLTGIHLSPLVKALLPDLLDCLAVQYSQSKQFDCGGFCSKAVSKLQEVLRGQCEAALFPMVHKKKT